MNKFKKALCLILSLVLTITLIPANSAQAASSTKSLDFTIKIRNSHQQLSWDSLNTSILSTNFQDFSGAVTVTYNFEQNEDKPGCTPEIYLRTGWNESDKLESPHTITDKGQKSLTVKYPAAKIKKILNSGLSDKVQWFPESSRTAITSLIGSVIYWNSQISTS